MAEFVHLA